MLIVGAARFDVFGWAAMLSWIRRLVSQARNCWGFRRQSGAFIVGIESTLELPS